MNFDAELEKADQWALSKRTVELAKLGLEDGGPGQEGKRPKPEDIHPAFLGYFHRKKFSVKSPVFFGKLSAALTRPQNTRGEGSLTTLKDLAKQKAFRSMGQPVTDAGFASSGSRACMAFPLAPVTRGKVRQRVRPVGEAYDRGEMIHPSCFG
ncbi:unnamed protein product [Sphacelaria rigidula]